ncbi:hypothetical protein GCM10009104_16990 [Marinobacterium maritimum]|uniref:LysR substrate-binding domain-containing protein n=2 Tax=Marinobacterium maritimum TaxID=500162 RepID=A0ABP3TBE9_9GAMM
MKKNAPDYVLRVEADWSQSMLHNLLDGYLDIALTSVPQTLPGIKVENLIEDNLILVSSTPSSLTESLGQNYIYVDWGPYFNQQHSLNFNNISTPTLTVGLSDLALQIITHEGGSAYLPVRSVEGLIESKSLYRVEGAPSFKIPLYLMYPEKHYNLELLELGLKGIREISNNIKTTS